MNKELSLRLEQLRSNVAELSQIVADLEASDFGKDSSFVDLKAISSECEALKRMNAKLQSQNERLSLIVGLEVADDSKSTEIYERIKQSAAQTVLQDLIDMAKEQGKHPLQTPVDWVKNIKKEAAKYSLNIIL